MNSLTTVSVNEIKKFEDMAKSWWDPLGDFKPLHELNPTRIEYIIKQIKNHHKIDSIENIDILDVGCGGGLVCEPLARLGAKLTGIDASKVNIEIAKIHAKEQNLAINYQQILVEELEKTSVKFSVILALEVIEHVKNVELFIKSCAGLLKPGGLLIFSTLNKSVRSYLESIIAAEYILNWVPRGTHDWNKFIEPALLAEYADKFGLSLIDLTGLSYSVFKRSWSLSKSLSNNYFASFISSS